MAAQFKNDNRCRGQILVLAVLILGLCTTLLMGLFHVSMAARHKIRLQLSADMAVLSVLNSQANALNSIALANRAILSNDAMAAQLNALVSETSFYRKLAEKFRRLLRFIPYAGAVTGFLSAGLHTLEKTVRRTTALILPLTHCANLALKKGQESVRLFLPILSLKAATSSLQNNLPQSRLTAPSRALIYQQARSLQQHLTMTEPDLARKLKKETMDRHTLRRNWRVRIGGLAPVKKTGGTLLSSDDHIARDTLELKVFRRLRWRWRSVVNSSSRVSDFHYQSPGDLMSLEGEDLSTALTLTVAVRSGLKGSNVTDSFRKSDFYALSAAKLIYEREGHEDENPNVFNPFWRSSLMPVAEEPSARRLIPGILLKEVKH